MSEPYDISHWALAAWGRAFDAWQAALDPDSDAALADYLEQIEAFFAAHPDGWPRHPDDPKAPEDRS